MLRLHDYAASANCFKVRLLLAQLGREYARVPVDIFAGDTLTDRFAAMNAARRTPVLEDGEGRFLPESNAILLYLGDGTRFVPEDAWSRAQVQRWLFFEQSLFEPTVGTARFWRLTGRDSARLERFAEIVGAANQALGMLESALAERTFLVADRYTVADISLYAYAHVAHEAGFQLGAFPGVTAWLARVAQTPRFMSDLEPYPPNSLAGAGSGIHS